MLITKLYDIPYREDGLSEHTLDICYPRGAALPLPVIVDIHGGGWSFGDKSLNRNYCSDLARLGFCVVNVNYRQLPEAPLKQQVRDIFAALHTLPLFAEEHHMNLNNLFLAGDSAGGQLALLCAAIAAKPSLQRIYQVSSLPFSVSAVGLSSPAPYIDAVGDVEGFEDIPKMLTHDLPRSAWAVDEIIRDASLPPICILSAEDDISWHNQSERLAGDFEKYDIPFLYSPFTPDAQPLGHVFNVTLPHSMQGKLANILMTDFFLSQIK